MSVTAHIREVEIDPVATILHGNALLIYYLIHNPNEPAMKAIEEALRRTPVEERHDIALRAKMMIDVATAVQKAMPRETAAAK